MSFRFHPKAESELDEAVAHYEARERGLGLDFAREVHAAAREALRHPSAWSVIGAGIRRCLVHRFPYGVIYTTKPDGILILAVMHLRRAPDYWKYRTESGGNS